VNHRAPSYFDVGESLSTDLLIIQQKAEFNQKSEHFFQTTIFSSATQLSEAILGLQKIRGILGVERVMS